MPDGILDVIGIHGFVKLELLGAAIELAGIIERKLRYQWYGASSGFNSMTLSKSATDSLKCPESNWSSPLD